jgi:hypothetical protein
VPEEENKRIAVATFAGGRASTHLETKLRSLSIRANLRA